MKGGNSKASSRECISFPLVGNEGDLIMDRGLVHDSSSTDLQLHSLESIPSENIKCSSTSNSFASSLMALKEISRPVDFSTALITPPKDSSSVFRQIIFDDLEEPNGDEAEGLVVSNRYSPRSQWWEQLMPIMYHSSDTLLHTIDDNKENEENSKASILISSPNKTYHEGYHNCESSESSEPIGLGITFKPVSNNLFQKEYKVTIQFRRLRKYKNRQDQFIVTLKIPLLKNLTKPQDDPDSSKTIDLSNTSFKEIFETTLRQVKSLYEPRRILPRVAKSQAKSFFKQMEQEPIQRKKRGKYDVHENKIKKRKLKEFSDHEIQYRFNDEAGEFECLKCNRGFSRLEHLKRHSRSLHSKIRPFACHLCDKLFARSDNLSIHLKLHAKSKEVLETTEKKQT